MASFVTKIRTTPSQPLTVDLEPGIALGFSFSSFPSTVSSNSVIGIVSGGVTPYTYAWTYLSGATGFNCNTPSAAETYWFKTLNGGVEETSTWRLTVTDAASTVVTADISITLSNQPYL